MDNASVILWSITVLIAAVAFFMIIFFLKGLIDRLITLVENLNDKVTSLEGEIRPVLKDLKKTLENVEPFTKQLGARGNDIGKLIENLEKVTDDAQATTGAIRTGIVPIANTLTGLFAGLMQGARALNEHIHPGGDESELD